MFWRKKKQEEKVVRKCITIARFHQSTGAMSLVHNGNEVKEMRKRW